MPPLIAIHTHCYGHLGGPAALDAVPATGLEFLEIPIRTAGFRTRRNDPPLITTESTLAELDQLARRLARSQLKVSSFTCLAGNPLDPRNLATMFRKLDLASHFGVQHVIGDAGSAADSDERLELYRQLQKIGDYAARLGIVVCFDTLRGICVNHREMVHVMRDLAHPALRINFDTGNILCFNENIQGETALAKSCHLVRHVHLKDFAGTFGDRNFPALGRGGRVDFLRVYQIMRDCGFRGPYAIEIEGTPDEGDLPLETYQARVVESIHYLRQLGYFDR
jgi:L-ribulose-5-phosphate 3-epimerase